MQKGERKRSVGNRHGQTGATVRAGPLMGIPSLLRELGQDAGPILDSEGFTEEHFEDPDTEMSYLAVSRLLANCVAATGCRHFGLLLGTRAGPSSLGVAGFMLRSAPDVGTALRGLVQHLDLHDQGGVPTLHISGGITRFGYAIHQAGTQATDQIYDIAIAVACNIMRALCGEQWNPKEVQLSHRPSKDLSLYRRFFRAPLRFNAEDCAVVFSTRWLEHRIPSADALLHQHLEQEAIELHRQRKATVTSELRALLRKSLLTGECMVADIAGKLHIHERTLNRRLREEGTSFHRELEDIRYEMSRHYLAESTMPMIRIAKALNYADVSAFSRAFKRWAGTTPAEWRRHNAVSPEA